LNKAEVDSHQHNKSILEDANVKYLALVVEGLRCKKIHDEDVYQQTHIDYSDWTVRQGCILVNKNK